MNHREAICGLDTGAFESIVEDRIFVGGEVETSGLLHDTDADVLGVAVGEERVRVVDGSGDEAEGDVESDFGDDELPEVGRERVAADNFCNVVQDVGGYLCDAEGQSSDDEAEK